MFNNLCNCRFLKSIIYKNSVTTTITQIIKHAETGYGTAYVYFKNKDDLLISLMEDVAK
jgi:hypothetical protein